MRVLLADDDPHVRSAVRLLLAGEQGVDVVGECTAAVGLIDQVLSARADVVLLDWDLPGLRAGTELQRLPLAAPGCRLVALSCRPEQQREALRAGAVRFVCKGDAPESLLDALRLLR
jgi:DNA-binding NarL/FixJ family response regulator